MFSALRRLTGALPSLFEAAESNDVAGLRAALERGEHVDSTRGLSLEPVLVAACRAGHADIVEALLDAGANACMRTDLPIDATSLGGAFVGVGQMVTRSHYSTTPLFAAACVAGPRGTACVTVLLARRPNIPILSDSFFTSPIEAALQAGNVASVQLLLDKLLARSRMGAFEDGSDGAFNVRSGAWLASACAGCSGDDLGPLEVLVERGLRADGFALAEVLQKAEAASSMYKLSGQYVTPKAATMVPLLRRLLQLGVDAHAAPAHRLPALAVLAGLGAVDAVQELLAADADPRLKFMTDDKEGGLHEHPLVTWAQDNDPSALSKAALVLSKSVIGASSTVAAAMAAAAEMSSLKAGAAAALNTVVQTTRDAARAAADAEGFRACALCATRFTAGVAVLGTSIGHVQTPQVCSSVDCAYAECAHCASRFYSAIEYARKSIGMGSGRCRALLEARAVALTAADGGSWRMVPEPRRRLPEVVGHLMCQNAPHEEHASRPTTTPLGISLAGLGAFVDALGGRDALTGKRTEELADGVRALTAASHGSYIDELAACSSGLVGGANVFVSHAWKDAFIETTLATIEAWEGEDAARAGTFYWLDVCTNSQHDTAYVPFIEWRRKFSTCVAAIGHTLLVLPWENPILLSRAWCVWEVASTVAERSRLTIAMPRASSAAFDAALLRDARAHGARAGIPVRAAAFPTASAPSAVTADGGGSRASTGLTTVDAHVEAYGSRDVRGSVPVTTDGSSSDGTACSKLDFAFANLVRNINLASCDATSAQDKVNILRAVRTMGGIEAVDRSVTRALVEWVQARIRAAFSGLSDADARVMLSAYAHLLGKGHGSVAALNSAEVFALLEHITTHLSAVVEGCAVRTNLGFFSQLSSTLALPRIKRSLAALRSAPARHVHGSLNLVISKTELACSLCSGTIQSGDYLHACAPCGASGCAFCYPACGAPRVWNRACKPCGYGECDWCTAVRTGATPIDAPATAPWINFHLTGGGGATAPLSASSALLPPRRPPAATPSELAAPASPAVVPLAVPAVLSAVAASVPALLAGLASPAVPPAAPAAPVPAASLSSSATLAMLATADSHAAPAPLAAALDASPAALLVLSFKPKVLRKLKELGAVDKAGVPTGLPALLSSADEDDLGDAGVTAGDLRALVRFGVLRET